MIYCICVCHLHVCGQGNDLREVEQKWISTTSIEQKMEDLLGLSSVLQDEGDFLKSLETLMDLLDICEAEKNVKCKGIAYANICDILAYQERYKEAAEYGEKAIAILENTPYQAELASAYSFTSQSYLGTDQYEEGLVYINKALGICEAIQAPKLRIAALTNDKGNVLKYLGRNDEALVAYRKSLSLAKELDHQGGISAFLANVSEMYMKMEAYKQALPYLEQSVEIAEKNNFQRNLMEGYGNLSLIHEKLGNYEAALTARQAYIDQREEIFNAEKEALQQELTLKYETTQKEALIDTQSEKINQQRQVQFLIGGFSLVLLGLLFAIYRSNERNKRSNKILEKTNTALDEKNQENELLLKEIHHRVKNNLQIISSLLSLQSRSIKDESVKDAILDSEARVRSMSLIHKKLYKGQELASVEMKEYLENLSNYLVDSYGRDELEVKINMTETEVDAKYAIPIGLMANELITNSLKYAFEGKSTGEIQISLRQKDDKIHLTIADNGQGKTKTKQANEDSGFGSSLVQLLTKQVRGTMTQMTDNGFKTQIEIPYKPSKAA